MGKLGILLLETITCPPQPAAYPLMGAIPALRPELMPMMIRPTIRSSYELAYLALTMKIPPRAIRMLFRSRPPFLKKNQEYT